MAAYKAGRKVDDDHDLAATQLQQDFAGVDTAAKSDESSDDEEDSEEESSPSPPQPPPKEKTPRSNKRRRSDAFSTIVSLGMPHLREELWNIPSIFAVELLEQCPRQRRSHRL